LGRNHCTHTPIHSVSSRWKRASEIEIGITIPRTQTAGPPNPWISAHHTRDPKDATARVSHRPCERGTNQHARTIAYSLRHDAPSVQQQQQQQRLEQEQTRTYTTKKSLRARERDRERTTDLQMGSDEVGTASPCLLCVCACEEETKRRIERSATRARKPLLEPVYVGKEPPNSLLSCV